MSEDATQTQATNETQGDLPQWARDQITKANNEAAKYRTEKNDAVEAAKAELTESFQTKIQELEAQVAEKSGEEAVARTEVEKLKAAIDAGIKSDKIVSFADLLKGDSPDELRSHADQLKELFSTDDQQKETKNSATDPTQGQGSTLPLNGDPLLKAVTDKLYRR